MKKVALTGENHACQPVATAAKGKMKGDIHGGGTPATLRNISVSAKQLKMYPAERRRAPREVVTPKPKGKLQLYTAYRYLDVARIRDISPFGVVLQLDVTIDDDALVRLRYTCNDMQIEVSGTAVWRKVVRLPEPNPFAAYGCWVGIFLHPSDIDANFALYQAIMGMRTIMRSISMPTKQPKPNPVERRNAVREELAQQPKGTLQLHIENRCLDVVLMRDISPFGVCLQLKAAVDRGTQVRLTYTCNGNQIEAWGVVVWGKVIKSPYPNPLDAPGCWVGIFLHPSSTDVNFALYRTIVKGWNDGLLDEPDGAA